MTDDTPEQVQPEIKTARRKPGRKPKGETPFSFTMQIRLTQTQHEAYKLLGEYQWLRNVLDYTAAHSASAVRFFCVQNPHRHSPAALLK